MSRVVTSSLLAVSLLLLAFPLVLPKPGMPVTLKADEPAYLLAALSLVRDGDLLCETRDLERLFGDFPWVTPRNLILASDDGWRTLTFGKPYVYSLFAAPFVALAGVNGMLAFNMLLFLAMVWMGTDVLRRHNGDALAALFAGGFFFLSTAFAYVFWLHPEVFMMAAGMACLYFGLHVAGREPPASAPPWWRRALDPRAAPAISAACLAFATYHKPMMAALGLPVLFYFVRRRHLRAAALWLASAATAMALAAGGSYLLAGYPSAYLVGDRAGFSVENPYRPPVEPVEPVASSDEREELDTRAAGWWWLIRVPDVPLDELLENLRYFFFGRHTGLVLYQPFAVLALALFLLHGRRDPDRWAVLVAIALVAAFFLIWIPFNWHGGGGFVGNRYFIIAYPAFLFLVSRIRPDWTVLGGYAAGGLLLGPLVLAPFGAIVPQGSLQAHARNLPFQLFPRELSLREIPGHWGEVFHDVYFLGRRDQMKTVGGVLWTQGGDRVELWLQSARPLEKLIFDVRSQAPENRVTLELDGARETVIAGREPRRVVLTPVRSPRIRRIWSDATRDATRIEIYVYRLVVTSDTGELPHWRGDPPQSFYLGAGLEYRGSDDRAARSAGEENVAESAASGR